jgi:RNA polymerase sigma factor (sigma-70 family)
MTPLEPEQSLAQKLAEGREQFLALVADLRPELHRYCARMTGSLADGEDIVQETLARAYYALPEFETLPLGDASDGPRGALRSWLFRIAHNRALDHLRRYEHRMSQPLDPAPESANDDAVGPEDALAREHALSIAVSRFVELAPAQRSCVILKDVANVAEVAAPTASPTVARYAALFNARDWDGVRAMLADDVRLDLVSRSQRAGRRDVGIYFTNYERKTDWRLQPAWLDGREVLAVYRNPADARPGYFIELTLRDERVALIRDFRYVPYVAHEAMFAFG